MATIHNPFSSDAHPDLTRAITDIVNESHSRAALEKMSITQLRALLKRYTGKPGSGRELADIRGLLRAKGAGVVLDEGRKGLGKTRYGKALQGLGDAAEKIRANPPKAPVNPFKKGVSEGALDEGVPYTPDIPGTAKRILKKGVDAARKKMGKGSGGVRGRYEFPKEPRMATEGVLDEAVPTTAAEWETANRPSRETARGLQGAMKKYLKKYGKPKPLSQPKPVREATTPCERAALERLQSANREDLKDKPGRAGARAHKRLHTTIGKILKK